MGGSTQPAAGWFYADGSRSTSPCSNAYAAAAVRDVTPSLPKMLLR